MGNVFLNLQKNQKLKLKGQNSICKFGRDHRRNKIKFEGPSELKNKIRDQTHKLPQTT